MTESNGWITRRRFLYGTTGLTIGGLLGANFSTRANAATGYGFGAPPAAGVHPRVVITPDEVSLAKTRVTSGLTQSAFNRLVAAPPQAALLTKLTSGTISATELETLAEEISGTALVALLGNSTQAAAAAPAARNAVNTWVQEIEPTNANNTGLTFHIALAYDWLFATLSSTERTTIRTWLVNRIDYWESRLDLLTYGFKQGVGEAEKRNFNWVPLTVGSFGAAALAVEGESGYDGNWYTKSRASMYDFLNHGISQEGAPLELFHYFAYGMWKGSYLLNAMARRSDTVLDHVYLKRVPRWWTSDMLPWGGDWNSLQDTKDSTSGVPSIFYLLRLAYSDDPVMRWVYKSYVDDVTRDVYDDMAAVLWGSELDSTDGARTAASLAMNPTQYFIANGLQYMRSAWGTDDVYFQFQSDPYAGETHAHADRNAFTLMSDGRIWFCDAGMHIPWDYAHNVVHIDGKAEGYFPQRGRIVTRTDGGFATGIMGDAKDAYDWKTDATSGGTGWQQVNGLWSYPYNPVQRAFRSGTLVRGTNPYVLISDDIRKDDASHEYSWEGLMPLGTAMVPIDSNTVMLEPSDIGASVTALGGSTSISFQVPANGNYRIWILSGREYTTRSGGYNRLQFGTETEMSVTDKENPAGGDASKPHWLPVPLQGGGFVKNLSASANYSVKITPVGTVTEVAFLVAPDTFDPTGVIRPVMPANSFLKRFADITTLPSGWQRVAAPTNYPRCMVKVLSPASVTVGVSTIRRYITDDENYGKAFKLKFRTTMVEPKFRVLLYPHRNGAPMPAVTSSSSQATLTWPSGTVDNWLFGPNTGFPTINGSAVSLTRGAESYTLGSA